MQLPKEPQLQLLLPLLLPLLPHLRLAARKQQPLGSVAGRRALAPASVNAKPRPRQWQQQKQQQQQQQPPPQQTPQHQLTQSMRGAHGAQEMNLQRTRNPWMWIPLVLLPQRLLWLLQPPQQLQRQPSAPRAPAVKTTQRLQQQNLQPPQLMPPQ
jgi:hypothetical protein